MEDNFYYKLYLFIHAFFNQIKDKEKAIANKVKALLLEGTDSIYNEGHF